MEKAKQKTDFSPHPELTRYNMMPKHFVGAETADDLFSIYTTLRNEKPYPSYLFVAGSAAAESGIIGTHLSKEERHSRVHCAQEAWRTAQSQYLERHIDEGWSEAKLTAFVDRVEAQVLFLPLIHDLINGNVRQETSNTTHERIVRLAIRNFHLNRAATQASDVGGYSARRGLAYELATTGSITRLRCPSFFAMPTIARGDNGTYNKSDTHDVQLIEQSWGSIRSSTPMEVKPSGLYRSHGYEVAYIHGRLHLSMPSVDSSLELCTILSKEILGNANAEEIAELNSVTSKILSATVGQTKHMYSLPEQETAALQSA